MTPNIPADSKINWFMSPPQSANLNTIENMWGTIKQVLQTANSTGE